MTAEPNGYMFSFRRNVRIALRMSRLQVRNRLVRKPIAGGTGPVLTLTTHGARIRFAHLAIESATQGEVLAQRVILWLDDPKLYSSLPPGIERLVKRGLEVKMTANLGPFTKIIPHVNALAAHQIPAVTIDDDIMYPANAVDLLVAAHLKQPDSVICHFAREVAFEGRKIAPYSSWGNAQPGSTSLKNFPLGVGSVLYPAGFLDVLRAEGDGFLETTPRNDDVWLHFVASCHGWPATRLQAFELDRDYLPIRGHGMPGLQAENVGEFRNDVQIGNTYRDVEIDALMKG